MCTWRCRQAGADLGLADAGYYALDALRIEAGRRAWGAELGPDETPFEAGTLFAVKLDKPTPFLGRDALLARRTQAPAKRLVSLVFDSRRGLGLGRRGAAPGGEPAGEITSAGWSPRLGACVALGYLRGAAAAERHAGTPVEVDVWGERVAATAWDEAARMQRATPGERRAGAVLAALDRRAGVRAVAAVRHRRGRDPAGDRAQRARPRRLGRAGRARGHPDRHRLAGVEPAGVDPHHPLRRALGDRRRRASGARWRCRSACSCRTWPRSPSACS